MTKGNRKRKRKEQSEYMITTRLIMLTIMMMFIHYITRTMEHTDLIGYTKVGWNISQNV